MSAAVLILVAGLVVLAPGRAQPSRVRLLVGQAGRSDHAAPAVTRRAGSIARARAWSTSSSRLVGEVMRGWLQRALARLGVRTELAWDDTRQGAALIIGSLVGALLAPVAPVLVVPVAAVALAVPWWSARAARRRQDARLVEALPDLVELFRLAVRAGLTVHQAVLAVARRSGAVAASALDEVARRESIGEPLADALERLGQLGEAVRPLSSALVAAERYGAPLGSTLDRIALEARLLRRRQAEEAARRLPVALLFPLVLCILPAFGLLTVVPVVVASLPHLGA